MDCISVPTFNTAIEWLGAHGRLHDIPPRGATIARPSLTNLWHLHLTLDLPNTPLGDVRK